MARSFWRVVDVVAAWALALAVAISVYGIFAVISTAFSAL